MLISRVADREAGWQAFQRGDLEEAISLLKTACQLAPDDYQAHFFLGAAYGKAGPPTFTAA